MPSLASDVLDVRPGVRVVRWPDNFPAASCGGTYLHAAFRADSNQVLQAAGEPPVFVAVRTSRGLWYGELVLCFEARYLGAEELCFIRWVEPARKRALVERRELTAVEKAGPFEAYRWSLRPGSRRTGHPRAGSPHYGVVSCCAVLYRAPLIQSINDALDAPDPLFRLVTDMYMLPSA